MTLLTYLYNLIWGRSVASITAPLAWIVTELEGHSTDKEQEAAEHQEWIDHYTAKRLDATTESIQAQNVASKVKALLS
jgi:hypothetical protein